MWQEGRSLGKPGNFWAKQAEDGWGKIPLQSFAAWLMPAGTMGIWPCLIFITEHRGENQWSIHPCVGVLPSSHCVAHKGCIPHRSTTFLYRLTQDGSLAVCSQPYMRYRGRCSDHGRDHQPFCCYSISVCKQIPRPKLWYEAQNKLISYVYITCAYLSPTRTV